MWTHDYGHTTTSHLSLHSKLAVATTARTDYNDLDGLARPVLQDVLESVPVLKAAEVHSQWRAAFVNTNRVSITPQVAAGQNSSLLFIAQLTCRCGRTSGRPASEGVRQAETFYHKAALAGTHRHKWTSNTEGGNMITIINTTHLAHDWGVDDGGQRLQIVDDDVVEQRDVVAKQLGQDKVFAWACSTTASGVQDVPKRDVR
jgi:hypothetical protein